MSGLGLDLRHPYAGRAENEWPAVTAALVDAHPLKAPELTAVVLDSWNGIFESTIGTRGFRLGIDIRPSPQIMGHYLHELIPLEFQHRYPGKWRREAMKFEKDLVCVDDLRLSVEIKTSSHATRIFGNRSYGQPAKDGEIGRKGKSGYYLAVNFEKFERIGNRPKISGIRFGWLDHSDWIAQKSETGQAASLRPVSEKQKLLKIYTAA